MLKMPIHRVVDNRVFILGLDDLYRDRMQRHEREELLACARKVSATLKTAPANVPIEGYYAEDDLLTEYFRLVRALQAVDKDRTSEVEHLQEFRRLDEVTSAPIFGSAVREGRTLLAKGRDPLSTALVQTAPGWALERLVVLACDLARETDDISLVGVAAMTKDAVAIAAVRESVVLYAEDAFGGLPPKQELFEWRVDQDLCARAKRFIEAFRQLFGDSLPEPVPENAQRYWQAFQGTQIHGRCVCLGWNDFTKPQYYHWAIRRGEDDFEVHEFWSPERWTTDRYRQNLMRELAARHKHH